MNYSIFVRPAVPRDCERLAPKVKPDDILEVEATGNCTALEALHKGLDGDECLYAYCGHYYGPIAMYGISSYKDGDGTTVGVPWMLSREFKDHQKREVWRHSKEAIERWSQQHAYLIQWVPTVNKKTIRWLKALGFECCETSIAPYKPIELITMIKRGTNV